MAEAGTRRARRWLGWGALPASIAALAVLLVRGAFLEPLELRAPHLAAWALLVGAGMVAVARQLRRKLRGVRSPWWWAAEACALSAIGALAVAQLGGGLTSPLYPLVYLLGAGYALALPLPAALPALGFLIGLDAALFLAQRALPAAWPRGRQGDGPALSRYEGSAPVACCCGVPLRDRQERVLGALVADRDRAFSAAEEQVLSALAAEVVRAMEAERLLAAVRREKEEKARFFRALEELNRTSTVAQAAECSVEQARRMGALDLCAITLVEEATRPG